MSSSHPHSSEELIGLRHPIFREGITRCTHFMMVARYLERCADHASKIAENVHYMATGERIEIQPRFSYEQGYFR